MPRLCGECEERIEPIALPFVTPKGDSGWFLVCPDCHYVYAKLDPEWFSVDPEDRIREQSKS